MKQTIVNTACIIGLTALIGIALWIIGVPELEGNPSSQKLLARSVITFPFFWAGISALVMVPMIWLKRAKLAESDKKFGRVVAIGVQMPALMFLLFQILVPLKLYDVLDSGMMDTIFFFFLVAFFFAIGNYLPTVPYRNRIGFRTSATLYNPIVWERSHRFLGRGLILVGLFSVLLPLLVDSSIATWIFLGCVVVVKAMTWLHARRMAGDMQISSETS